MNTERRRTVQAGLGAIAMVLGGAQASAAAGEINAATENDGRHDFDFFAESVWNVSHRRLKAFLADATEWDAFSGTVTTRTFLNNLGTIDENEIHAPAGTYRGSTLRLFDPAARLWAVHWMDGRSGVLEPGARGRWEDGRCTLLSDDTFAGRPIKLRQIYSRFPERNPHWEQAMSVDGGATWETNWHMDYSRA
jgi:hypothetical protein